MKHLSYSRDDDSESLFPSLDEEELKNYTIEANIIKEIFEKFNGYGRQVDSTNLDLANETGPQINDPNLRTETCLSQTEDEIDLDILLPEEASFSISKGQIENYENNIFKREAIEDLKFCEENKIALVNSFSPNRALEEIDFFRQQAEKNQISSLTNKLNQAYKKINIEENKIVNNNLLDFDSFSHKFKSYSSNDEKLSIPSFFSNPKTTNSVENKSHNLLRNKTNRSEASTMNTRSKGNSKNSEATEPYPHDFKRKVDFQLNEIKDEKPELNNGRWSNDEHKNFIDALIKYGKKWKKIKAYIKTRNYFQIVQYTTRFFNRIKKAFNLKANLSYDSMSSFKKLNKQKQIKKRTKENPKYDLELQDCKDENDKNFHFQNLFFEFISGINTNNFIKFCDKYRAVISNEIKSFLIQEFLILNPTKKKNFRTIKVNLIQENDKDTNEKGLNLSSADYRDKDYEVIEKPDSKNQKDFCKIQLFNSFNNLYYNNFENSKAKNNCLVKGSIYYKQEKNFDSLSNKSITFKNVHVINQKQHNNNDNNKYNNKFQNELDLKNFDLENLICPENSIFLLSQETNSFKSDSNSINDYNSNAKDHVEIETANSYSPKNYIFFDEINKSDNLREDNGNKESSNCQIKENMCFSAKMKKTDTSKIGEKNDPNSIIENDSINNSNYFNKNLFKNNINDDGYYKVIQENYKKQLKFANLEKEIESKPPILNKNLNSFKFIADSEKNISNPKLNLEQFFNRTKNNYFRSKNNSKNKEKTTQFDTQDSSIYENLKIYFQDNIHNQFKNLNLSIEEKKEFEFLIREKLRRYMVSKDQRPTFIFNSKTNGYEISNKQGKTKSSIELKTVKKPRKSESLTISEEEMTKVKLIFSDPKSKKNLNSLLNREEYKNLKQFEANSEYQRETNNPFWIDFIKVNSEQEETKTKTKTDIKNKDKKFSEDSNLHFVSTYTDTLDIEFNN